MHMHGMTWLLVPAMYAVSSLISFALYAGDKRAARRGEHRVAERTLHILDLLGGWPGGWLAQKALRHKCSKLAFQRGYVVTVLVNMVLLGCLLFLF